jgi:outer membrane protein W
LKTTKLLVLALLLLVGLTASTNAQFYVKLGAGYGFLPIAGMSHFPDSADYKSFGMGVQPTLGFGYHVTKNIALELNGMYLIGQKFEQTPTGTTITTNGEGIFISPAFRVQAPLKSVTPYTRIGLVIGIPKVKSEVVVTDPASTNKYEQKGGISMGMEGALGMDIKASKKINVFIELGGMALNYAPDELENTESTGTVTPTFTYTDSNRPYIPFGNFGAKVGISILFGKMPKK